MKSRICARIVLELFVCSAMIFAAPLPNYGQEDPIAELRTYPPEFIGHEKVETGLNSLDWQLSQQHALQNKYLASRSEINQKLEKFTRHIDELDSTLPAEVRFLSDPVRSQLIGKAMERLLDAQLELATLEKSISQFEKQLEKGNFLTSKLRVLKKQEMHLQTRSCETRLSLATQEFEKVSKLQSSGNVSSQSVNRAAATLEIARIEYETSKTREEIALEGFDAEIAGRVTDERVRLEPTKAKIAAIERFLKMFSDSASTRSLIENTKRSKELCYRDLELVATEAFEIGRRIEDLESLKERVQARGNELNKKKKERVQARQNELEKKKKE